jgi:hypothetical protein
MPGSRWIVPLAVVCLLVPARASAQQFPGSEEPLRSGFGLEAAAGYRILAGEVGDSIGGGLEIEGMAFWQPRDLPARFGVGAEYAWFDFDRADGSMGKLSLFGTATLLIRSNDTSMLPYVQGRIGWTRLSDDQGCGPPYEQAGALCGAGPGEVTPGTRTRSGIEIGAVVGVDIPVGERLSLDVGGTFNWLAVGDFDFEGTTLPDTDAAGSAFGLRAGATYFLGP